MIKKLGFAMNTTLFLTTVISSIAFGKVIKDDRSVNGFDQIELRGYGEVILTRGTQEILTVEADEDMMSEIISDVRNRTLYLDVKNRHWMKNPLKTATNKIKYFITMKNIQGLSISGSGEITSENIETDHLEIRISGSGNVEIESIQSYKLNMSISGSGNCYLAGEVGSQKITISGSGTYSGEHLDSDEAFIIISGSGDAAVWVKKNIDAQISGSGDVKYAGEAEDVFLKKSGSGTIRKIGGSWQ